jgi:hypothetical protein
MMWVGSATPSTMRYHLKIIDFSHRLKEITEVPLPDALTLCIAKQLGFGHSVIEREFVEARRCITQTGFPVYYICLLSSNSNTLKETLKMIG